MTCPKCYAEFESGPGVCPECGVQLLRNISGLVKTSAIMISAAGERGFYRSVRDVPEGLRQQLLKVTAGENAGTIVIADQAGKDQLTEIVARRDAAAGKSARVPAVRAAAPAEAGSRGAPRGLPVVMRSWAFWAGLALVLGSAGVVAAVFTMR
jgi:hypothetical protein